MRQLRDFSDTRYKGSCIHCGAWLADVATNVDHVPSKALLDHPLPTNAHTVETCVRCNSGFSSDEEYFAAFLGAAMCGSTDPSLQVFETARIVLAGNSKLRREIEGVKAIGRSPDGEPRLVWQPDIERVRRVVIKNARGHVRHELGRPMSGEPDHVMIEPLETIDEAALANFLDADMGGDWPEIGSRLFQRVYEGIDMADGRIIVQPGVYVFAVLETGSVVVRSIIREYLLTEVVWDD